MNITDAFKFGVFNKSLKNNRLQRAANSLKWRQVNQTSASYTITLDISSGNEEDKVHEGSDIATPIPASFTFQQFMNPESHGIGTGGMVWPAAHVLAKFIERKLGLGLGLGLLHKNVCEIGSGTGAVGIVAAGLGGDVICTDQECVRDIMETNLAAYNQSDAKRGSAIFTVYDWDSDFPLPVEFDLVLVSDW